MSTYYVSSGQISTGIILNSADYMFVYESGVADSTTVIYDGYLYVSSGGMADSNGRTLSHVPGFSVALTGLGGFF